MVRGACTDPLLRGRRAMTLPIFRLRPLLLAVVLLLALPAAAADRRPHDDRAQARESGRRVAVDPALVEVGDGDTVVIRWSDDERERVRILGIDTPETDFPGHGWSYDQAFGPEAEAFARGAFAVAHSIEILRAAETDPYGRTLAYVFLDGRNYSVLAVAAGYAVETVSHYGDNGFPAEAEAVLQASRAAGPVPFEPPHEFRRRMRELNEFRK